MDELCKKQIVFYMLAGMALSGAAHAQEPATQPHSATPQQSMNAQQSANKQQATNTEQTGKPQTAGAGQQAEKSQPAAKSQQADKSQQAEKSKGEGGQKSVTAHFLDTQGKRIGKAMLMDTPSGLLIQLDVAGLPPGEHGFHIHERGVCDAKEGFKTAGEHFTPRKEPHGFFDKKGRHAGDMPNQIVSQDGRLQADVLNREVVLNSASLHDKDGSALIVHAKPDDYVTQPSGGAGDRIACAVVHAGSGQKTAQPGSASQTGAQGETGARATPGKTAQQTGSLPSGAANSSAR
jgi:Cu-Zn family superoxide dismutase